MDRKFMDRKYIFMEKNVLRGCLPPSRGYIFRACCFSIKVSQVFCVNQVSLFLILY